MLQIKARYVPRCNTSAGWLLETIPLLEGEVGIETDTYKWKIGKIKVGGDNLLTPWNELKYMGSITSGYFPGNLLSIDADGNIVVSDTKVSDLETADETILKQADIVNDLTTGGIDVPLSAEQGKLLKTDVDKKADKVIDAITDNFASLDANGNLKDSGKKATDFEIADTAIMKTDEAQIMTADLTLKGVPTTDNMAASKKYVDDGFEPKDITILKKANVVNDLTTGGIDVPLSAEQGKALSQDLEILDDRTQIHDTTNDITYTYSIKLVNGKPAIYYE